MYDVDWVSQRSLEYKGVWCIALDYSEVDVWLLDSRKAFGDTWHNRSSNNIVFRKGSLISKIYLIVSIANMRNLSVSFSQPTFLSMLSYA